MRLLGQFQTSLFFYEKISSKQKAQKCKQAIFFPLNVFYAHKNAAFFVFVHLFAFYAFCLLEIFSKKKKEVWKCPKSLIFIITLLIYKYLFVFVFAELLSYWNSFAAAFFAIKIKRCLHVSYMQLSDCLRIHNITYITHLDIQKMKLLSFNTLVNITSVW